MANNKHTVETFSIDLELNDKITKGLAGLEKDVFAAAERMEKRLSRLKVGFEKTNLGQAFSQSQQQGRARNTPNGNNSAKTKSFDSTAQSKANAAFINKTLLSGGKASIEAMAAQARIWAAGAQANLDQSTSGFQKRVTQINEGLRNFNKENRTAAGSVKRLGTQAESGVGTLAKLYVVFESLHAAVELIKYSIEQGIERQRGIQAMQQAYQGSPTEAKNQMAEVKELSDTYGTKLSEAYKESARLKSVLGKVMNDQEISQYHESITVMGGTSGATEDEKQRFTAALSKGGSNSTFDKNYLNDMSQAMAPVVAGWANSMGMNRKQLDDYRKKVSGASFAKSLTDYMAAAIDKVNPNTGKTAKESYAGSEQVQLQKVANDWRDSAVIMNDAAQEGISDFAGSLSNLLRTNQWAFESLGSLLGAVAEDLAGFMNKVSDTGNQLDIYRLELVQWYQSLSTEGQHAIDFLSDFTRQGSEALLLFAGLSKLGKFLTSIMGFFGAGGGAAATTAEGGAVAGGIAGGSMLAAGGAVTGLGLLMKMIMDSFRENHAEEYKKMDAAAAEYRANFAKNNSLGSTPLPTVNPYAPAQMIAQQNASAAQTQKIVIEPPKFKDATVNVKISSDGLKEEVHQIVLSAVEQQQQNINLGTFFPDVHPY